MTVLTLSGNQVTSGELITGALRLLGVVAEGELPSSETAADSLVAMNQMIESWNTERLSVFSTQDQIFSWPATVISRTMGPTGDFVDPASVGVCRL